MMAHRLVVNAVRARLAANFTGCPVYGENTLAESPKDGSAFIVLQFPWSRSVWETLAGPDGCDHREEGAFRFVLSVPRDGGVDEGRQWLDEIASLFRGEEFDDVQCYAPDSPVSDDRNETGSYYRLTMAVPYQFIVTQGA